MAATEDPNKFADLPSLSEMIMGAIAALDEKSGSNKSAIIKHIESTYGGRLPEDYTIELSAELTRMKDSGELVFSKNNYMKPGSDIPPKRGRGRPPKPKPALPPGYVPPPPRPRGRPPKAKDPLLAAHERASSGLPRPRGRPPKKSGSAGEEGTTGPTATAPPPSGMKRGRGRPPKVRPQPAPEVGFA